ncbi:hypothetical protein ACFWNR_00675 [Streptomyces virginiae]|uniref:hypothetical protein n=1 Tax=Streptomyces virginiae TaxID=1961 RepID=UPI00364CB144
MQGSRPPADLADAPASPRGTRPGGPGRGPARAYEAALRRTDDAPRTDRPAPGPGADEPRPGGNVPVRGGPPPGLDAVEETAERLRTYGSDGIITYSEQLQRVTAHLAKLLELRYDTRQMAELLTDKW